MSKKTLKCHINLSSLIILAGIIIILLPTIMTHWNSYKNDQFSIEYDNQIASMSNADLDAFLEPAREYNRNHTENVIIDPFLAEAGLDTAEYEGLLNIDGMGLMGHLKIPAIRLTLPIYHGATDESMSKGCGHMMGTSLPIGGESTHAVLCSHRGIPSADLFKNLGKLQAGDEFIITILGQEYIYEVTETYTVDPEDASKLQIEQGKDLVTLLTCTPYGVNSHRLLVRGQRKSSGD